MKRERDRAIDKPFPKLAGKRKILWTKLKSSSKRERLENNVTMKCEGCVSRKKVAIQWEAREDKGDREGVPHTQPIP